MAVEGGNQVLQDRFPLNNLHESWASKVLTKVKITDQVETSAGHVDICEQNPVCQQARDIQHRNKNSEQCVYWIFTFPKKDSKTITNILMKGCRLCCLSQRAQFNVQLYQQKVLPWFWRALYLIQAQWHYIMIWHGQKHTRHLYRANANRRDRFTKPDAFNLWCSGHLSHGEALQ